MVLEYVTKVKFNRWEKKAVRFKGGVSLGRDSLCDQAIFWGSVG